MMTAAFPPVPRAQGSGDVVDVADLLAELRTHGFDLRRAAVVTYLIETGADRASAYALRSEAAGEGWQATLYGDRSGWVVRLCSRRLLRRELFADDLHDVERLARAHGASVRGATVEDLLCDDDWQALAMRLEHVARTRPAAARAPRTASGPQAGHKASLPHSA